MLIALMFTLTGFAQTFTIGTGTSTNSNTTYPAPYGHWYNGAKHQFLVLASELSTAGVTTQRMFQNVQFNVATANGDALTNFTIKMANTSATSLTTTFLTGLTQVYTVSSYTETSGWNTHTFGSPFVWDGTSNLVFEVCFDNYPTGYTYNALTYYSTTSFNSSAYFYSDGGGVCATATGYTASTSRTNMRFLITTPVAYDVVMNQIVSPTSWAVGNNTITVQAANYGTTSLTAADFGYQLGSNTPVTATGVSISPARTTGQTVNYTFGTALNIPAAGTYTLKVWVRNPNGQGPDANTSNDTITTTICTGIAGSFTINPAGSGGSNYTSFSAAVAALNSCGVSGPCTFTVSPGTYTEKITLNNIVGTSAVNTIVFDCVDSATRKLVYNETSNPSNPAVINFVGASYITFKNLGITAQGATTSIGVIIQSGSNFNKIINCNINVSAVSTSSYCYGFGVCGGTYSTASSGSNNYFENCTSTGGYVGASLYTTSGGASNNVIRGNKITNMYYMGIYTQYQTNDSIMDNFIKFRASTALTYGIYNYYALNYHIERNIVSNFSYMGVYSYAYNVNSTNATLINNIFNGSNSYVYAYQYGIYMYYTNNVKIYHNTMYVTGSNSYGAYISYGTGMDVKNNIFHSTGVSGYCLYVPYTSGFNTFDYNILYSSSPTTFVYWGAAFTDLAALKAGVSGFHQKSISKVANFVSLTNLAEDFHLTSSTPAETGDPTANVPLDVDKEARCLFAPSIGADESKYTTGPPVAGFTAPDSIFVNSPVVLFNNNPSNAPLGHRWYLNGTYLTNSINLPYTFTSTGTYTFKLVTQGCFGIDSITKVITVYNPTQKPISDFISDLNVVETYQQVRFTDLSVKGPTYWYWTFIPSAGVNYNNGTTNLSQNPVVSFTNPGLYQVCLWDSNSVGRSIQNCKTAYILVKATNQMCIFPFDTKVASGTLYDDGGPNGNYSTGGTCNFLIDPCASSVNLKFTQFNLSTNSYLRVYNGKDNLSPPLHTGLGFNGLTIPGGAAGLTASSGKMYIEFVKGTAAPGFAASWTSVASSTPAPTGKLVDPDTAYDCGAYTTFTYVPTSLAFPIDGANYKWYFDYANSNSFPDVEGKGIYTQDWSYGSTGVYIIRLDIEGCGGTQTIIDTLVIAHPLTGPIVNFKADLLTATPADVVNLTDLSTLDPIWWKWTITGPGTVNAVSGNSNSKNYGVKFTTPGVYTVQLKDSNCVGSNTLIKTGYITIIKYCDPSVASLNADFAIERFIFGRADTIINNTVYGLDYTNTSPAVGTVTYRDNTNKFRNYTINNITLTNKAVEAVVGLGETFDFTVKRASNFNQANFKIWIDYNQDGIFDPVTELAAASGPTSGVNFTGSITIPQSAKIGYTRLRIGTNFGSNAIAPCGGNQFGEFNDFHVKVTPDITPPVITITGNIDTAFVEVGRIFSDPGTTVTGATTVTHSGLAYGATVTTYPSLGVHTITATDASGNTAIRNIYIRATKDITKPVITRTGADTVYSEVGSTYTDLGATASDFYYGVITGSIIPTSTVNTAKTGVYTVIYNVNDAAGNAANAVVRVVIIRDTQLPVITISGPNPLYVNVFSTFNPPAATVVDNYNTGLTYTISGTVNTNLLGTYILSYNAKDSSGNLAATKTLTVIVRDITPPQITLIPQDTMIIDCITLTNVPEPGFIVSDNYYSSTQITVSKVGTVNLIVLGTYVIRYYAADPSGNIDSSKTRVYRVIDRVAPVITLKGLAIMNWPRWKAFVDPGYTIYDKCDPTATVTADYSKLDINLDGLYEVNYSSTDASGNKASDVKRYVNIYTAVSGINNNGGNNLFMVYPNPSHGLLNIDLNIENATSANIMIYDANGKLVYSGTNINPNNNKVQIDLSNEASGMYFIKIVTDNFSASRAFSIQK